jgi:hypothetical protein
MVTEAAPAGIAACLACQSRKLQDFAHARLRRIKKTAECCLVHAGGFKPTSCFANSGAKLGASRKESNLVPGRHLVYSQTAGDPP